MNSLRGLGLGHVSCGFALAIIGASAACSSSSSPTTPTADGGVTTTVEASAGVDGGTVDGSGGPCPALTDEWVASFIALSVTWPEVLGANGGTGSIYIWLLAHYTINGSQITGTTRTCGNQTPALVLNATGAMSIGQMPGNVQVLFQQPTSGPHAVWDPDTKTAASTGILGGWNIGSSITINPSTSAQGIASTSQYADPSTPWPKSATSFATSDIEDDDHDGNPGITLYPVDDAAMNDYLPATSTTGTAPLTQKLFIVSRTELSLYGTSTSCTEGSGTVTVPEFNDHVIGCQDVNSTVPCTADEWQFLDGQSTVYSGAGGKGSLITGTFKSLQLQPDADGGPPSCDDVVAAAGFADPLPEPPLPANVQDE
jgi:hypothetical protein